MSMQSVINDMWRLSAAVAGIPTHPLLHFDTSNATLSINLDFTLADPSPEEGILDHMFEIADILPFYIEETRYLVLRISFKPPEDDDMSFNLGRERVLTQIVEWLVRFENAKHCDLYLPVAFNWKQMQILSVLLRLGCGDENRLINANKILRGLDNNRPGHFFGLRLNERYRRENRVDVYEL